MNPDKAEAWKVGVLDTIVRAIAESPALANAVVLKGGQILSRRLGKVGRVSLDLDASLTPSFVRKSGAPDSWAGALEAELRVAIERSFDRMDPAHYSLERIRAAAKKHPRGWDGVDVSLGIADRRLPGARGLPAIRLDFSAPERLTAASVSPIEIDGHFVSAYTLERIAAEKVRALLQSLPAWRAKIGSVPRDVPRVRDVHDLARILAARSETVGTFWEVVASEFRIACESRFVDCEGMESFEGDRQTIQVLYETDPKLSEIPFSRAWSALETIVRDMETRGAVPIRFPLPDLTGGPDRPEN
ncbi:MAG: nucleotidyl transferase AbiEii/AbiGii toxin family protein [Planctomycetes bacterium]|nr:nucleotidyl transferase AbiEii/AbiGii toxin family protein [Planctomycetota bacterium]